jgi:hypothetical protein
MNKISRFQLPLHCLLCACFLAIVGSVSVVWAVMLFPFVVFPLGIKHINDQYRKAKQRIDDEHNARIKQINEEHDAAMKKIDEIATNYKAKV